MLILTNFRPILTTHHHLHTRRTHHTPAQMAPLPAPAVPPPTINPATIVDVPAIVRLVTAAYTLYIPRIGRCPAPMQTDYGALLTTPPPGSQITVLKQNDQLLGLIELQILTRSDHETSELRINSLAVDPAAQGRGYGRLLMEHAEAVASQAGVKAITLYTNVKMWENVEIYGKMGYVEVGRRVEDGFERVYFQKEV